MYRRTTHNLEAQCPGCGGCVTHEGYNSEVVRKQTEIYLTVFSCEKCGYEFEVEIFHAVYVRGEAEGFIAVYEEKP